jgi:hypothetical protein
MKTVPFAFALLATTALARAETPQLHLEPGSEYFSTFFSFSVRESGGSGGSGGGSKILDATPTARVEIPLPPEFVGWRCYRTPQSSMKQLEFENVACWHGEFTTGVSVACRNNQESRDTKSFFLRAPGANGTVEVQISGGCMTASETVRYDDGF